MTIFIANYNRFIFQHNNLKERYYSKWSIKKDSTISNFYVSHSSKVACDSHRFRTADGRIVK